MLTQHFPLFLQFGFREQPEAAQELLVGDIVTVEEFGLLVNANGTKRVFQPGSSDPRGYFVDAQQKIIIPSCAATVFKKTWNSKLKQFRQVAVISLLEQPKPSKNKFRWEAEFASLHFQKGGSARNAHMLDCSHNGGFFHPPMEGQFVWIHAYGKQKNQTLYIGDLVVPATWAKYAEPAETGECVLMWMERLPQETKVILERNQGLGMGNHTPDSFRGD